MTLLLLDMLAQSVASASGVFSLLPTSDYSETGLTLSVTKMLSEDLLL